MFCLEGVAGLEPALTGLEAVSLPINQYAHIYYTIKLVKSQMFGER